MAAPTVGLVLIKKFLYRGNANEEFSNKYLLTGSTPSDSAAWRALFDALVAQEKTLYPSTTTVVRGYGYDDPDPDANSVWSVDLTVSPNNPVAGTYTPGGSRCPGDAAVWVRWGLDRFNTKGKRVYLRKYFHPAYNDGTTFDQVHSAWTTAANAFGAKLEDGSFLAARKITDHLGTALVGHASGAYVTTRTLKRRGKRPPP
jgi:hypothetical protein